MCMQNYNGVGICECCGAVDIQSRWSYVDFGGRILCDDCFIKEYQVDDFSEEVCEQNDTTAEVHYLNYLRYHHNNKVDAHSYNPITRTIKIFVDKNIYNERVCCHRYSIHKVLDIRELFHNSSNTMEFNKGKPKKWIGEVPPMPPVPPVPPTPPIAPAYPAPPVFPKSTKFSASSVSFGSEQDHV